MAPPHRRRHARLTSLALLLFWEVSLCGCNGSPAESRPSRTEAATTADTASFTLTPTEIVIGQSDERSRVGPGRSMPSCVSATSPATGSPIS